MSIGFVYLFKCEFGMSVRIIETAHVTNATNNTKVAIAICMLIIGSLFLITYGILEQFKKR